MVTFRSPIRFPAQLSLRWVLVVPFVLQTLGAVVLVGYLSYRSGQQATASLANQLLQQTSERVRDRIHHVMALPQQNIADNRLAVQEGILDVNNREQLRRQLWKQMQLNPSLMYSGFLGESGRAVMYSRVGSQVEAGIAQKLTGQPVPLGTISLHDVNSGQRQFYTVDQQGKPQRLLYQLQNDYRQMDWYRQSRLVNRQHWTPIFVGQMTGVLQMIAVAPVQDAAGQLQGFFTSVYWLASLSEFLNELHFSSNGKIFILEQSGELVASSVPADALATQWMNGQADRLPVLKSQDLRTREVSRQLLRQLGNFASQNQPQQKIVMVAGQRQFVQITPYRDSYGLNWSIVTVIPESDFIAEIQRNTYTTVLLCLLTLGVAIASGFALAHCITVPITRLNRASQALAAGDLTQQLSVNHPITEVQGLSRSFNQMAEQLRQLFQRQVEAEATRQSEARFQQLAAVVPGMIYTYVQDPDGSYRFDYVSAYSQTILELEPAQILSNPSLVLEQIYPSDRLRYQAAAHHSATTLEPFAFSFRNITPSGQLKWLEAHSCPFQYADGSVSWHGIVLDVSDRKRVEEQLRAEAGFRRAIENAIVEGLAIADIEGRQVYVNPAFCRMVGWSAEELVGAMPPYVYWPPEEIETITQSFQLTLQGRRPPEGFELRFMRRTGERFDVLILDAPLRNARGEITDWLASVYDISDRKRAERELARAKEAAEADSQAKSAFLASLSHELRSPLNVILGFSQLMERESNQSAEQQEYINLVINSSHHLLKLINQMLDLFKIEAKKMQLENQKTDLYLLLDLLYDLFIQQCAAKNLQIHLEVARNVPENVLVDAQKLRQILINLMSNAVKFTESGGISLRVTVDEKHETAGVLPEGNQLQVHELQSVTWLCFAVQDTGTGIAPEELDLIFEAFAQTTAGQQLMEGTGLGLTISRNLVRLMGGEIMVQSTLGRGSTFQFTIPVQRLTEAIAPSQHSRRKVAALAPGQPTYRILVVDDQRRNRLLLIDLLTPLGFQVQEAATGEQAIALWQTWHPHLILMDLRMAGLDGEKTTQRIRDLEMGEGVREHKQRLADATCPTWPVVVIALTAQAFEGDRKLALAAGCDDYISKPFALELLLDKIAQHLGLTYTTQED